MTVFEESLSSRPGLRVGVEAGGPGEYGAITAPVDPAVAVFEARESAVRGYCRSWPVVFDRAVGSWLYDESGRPYLDYFTGASALNYGHNNPVLKAALLDYLTCDRVTHSLDMFTVAKREFLTTFDELILRPRQLDYRVQFPGPGGANAVEAALKLARKVTGRSEVIHFSGSFHGMTLGALSVNGSAAARVSARVPLTLTTELPYDDAEGCGFVDAEELDRAVARVGCDTDDLAAVIVETVQGEGGIRVARHEWLRCLAQWCTRRDALLIVDDVQMGCGRTGPFFSFEPAGITPDLVCLSKSIGGYGLPLALTLIRPELDVWEPGEHNGTFRGVNPAFVTGTAALHTYWRDDALERSTFARGCRIERAFAGLVQGHPEIEIQPRGRGLARGLAFADAPLAIEVRNAAFERGLLVETAGPSDEVVKLLPPLTITDAEIDLGMEILADSLCSVCG